MYLSVYPSVYLSVYLSVYPVLGKVRRGVVDDAVGAMLASLRRPLPAADGILPTILHTHRKASRQKGRIHCIWLSLLPKQHPRTNVG